MTDMRLSKDMPRQPALPDRDSKGLRRCRLLADDLDVVLLESSCSRTAGNAAGDAR